MRLFLPFVVIVVTGCAWTEPFPSQTLAIDASEKGALCRLSNDRGTWTMVAPGTVYVLESPNPLDIACEKSGQPPGQVRVHARPASVWPRVMMQGGARAWTDPRGYAPHRYPAAVRVTLGRSETL